MKILVVENNTLDRKKVRKILKDNGYRLISATAADTALIQIKMHLIDLVIVNHDLPITKGIELVREMARIKKTPIIIGMSNNKKDSQYYEYFWAKNDSPKKLIALIKKLVRK